MVKRYLSLLSLDEALRIMTSSFAPPRGTESVPLMQAIGRVTAAPVHARYSVPEVNISAMDGIAVRSRDTVGAQERSPVTLATWARVNTGNIVPPEFDAVVMIEDTWETGQGFQIRKAASPWQHIRPAGEDIREGRLVLPPGHVVRAFDIGALATYGITGITARNIRIGIIPTGGELVPFGVRPGPGQVVESNTLMAQVFLQAMGARCTRYPIVPDDPDRIREVLRSAVEANDLVLISAGSSAGTHDFTEGVIRSLGELLFHGVAMKPGKPVMLGRVDGKPVLGLPGYPLAAQTVLREFAAPLLEHWGFPPAPRTPVTIRLAQPLASDLGFDEFVPVFVGRIAGCTCGVPHGKGAGVQMATVKANGYTHIPAHLEGLDAGTEVEVFLTTDPGSIGRTLILTGSLDPSLEELANLVHDRGLYIHGTNLGNTGAFLALRQKSCHAAPVSLPAGNPRPSRRPLLLGLAAEDVVFVHIATVEQGIASRDGLGIGDLVAARFINTRRETPARMVLDDLLEERGIDPARVSGYRQEVYGPQAVAAAIRNGFADAGMCTSGVASAAGLRFVPLVHEDYELAIRRDMLGDARIRTLVEVIRSKEYRDVLGGIGGYDLSLTGTIRGLGCDQTLAPLLPGTLPDGYG